jgi:hypothetical protein
MCSSRNAQDNEITSSGARNGIVRTQFCDERPPSAFDQSPRRMRAI